MHFLFSSVDAVYQYIHQIHWTLHTFSDLLAYFCVETECLVAAICLSVRAPHHVAVVSTMGVLMFYIQTLEDLRHKHFSTHTQQ